LQQQPLSPLKVTKRAQRLPERRDLFVDDYNKDEWLSHEAFYERADILMIEEYGEEMRVLINLRRAEDGDPCLEPLWQMSGRGLLVDDYNEDEWISHEEFCDIADRRMIEGFGEEARILINQRRVEDGYPCLEPLPQKPRPSLFVKSETEDTWLTHEEAWEQYDRCMFEHFGEKVRAMLNQEREQRGWTLL